VNRRVDPLQPPVIDTTTGRWILGKATAKACPDCGHPPVVKYAGNGKAEYWHTPTHCCFRSAARERRLNAISRREQDSYDEVES
jgi:hypothetical protein